MKIFNIGIVIRLVIVAIKWISTGEHIKRYIGWLIKYHLVIFIIFQPIEIFKRKDMSVKITDVGTSQAYLVDNLPSSLVTPASVISGVRY